MAAGINVEVTKKCLKKSDPCKIIAFFLARSALRRMGLCSELSIAGSRLNLTHVSLRENVTRCRFVVPLGS
jgi:hypothetical protein